MSSASRADKMLEGKTISGRNPIISTPGNGSDVFTRMLILLLFVLF
jgi:hypothetical protein